MQQKKKQPQIFSSYEGELIPTETYRQTFMTPEQVDAEYGQNVDTAEDRQTVDTHEQLLAMCHASADLKRVLLAAVERRRAKSAPRGAVSRAWRYFRTGIADLVSSLRLGVGIDYSEESLSILNEVAPDMPMRATDADIRALVRKLEAI